MISVTKKHRRKLTRFFDEFLAVFRRKRRIRVKKLQKMLGLMIWISTVFRVTRQFLTSICEILRLGGSRPYFRPNTNKSLVARVLFDLKF